MHRQSRLKLPRDYMIEISMMVIEIRESESTMDLEYGPP
jgi:hypothetical protein